MPARSGSALAQATAVDERSRWGTPMMGGPHALENVSIALLYVPEGSVTVMHCRHCGGRDEHLTNAVAVPSDVARTRDAAVLATRVADFVANHAECHTRPHLHRVDDAVTAFAAELADAAACLIGSGSSILPTLYLLDGADVYSFAMPFSAVIPENADAFRIALATLQADVRRFIREQDIAVRAVMFAGPGWAVASSPVSPAAEVAPKRKEMLGVTVVTPTAGHLGLAPITRATTYDGRCIASVGTLEWQVLDQWAPMTDGVLATSTVVNEPEMPRDALAPPIGWMDGTGGTSSLIH